MNSEVKRKIELDGVRNALLNTIPDGMTNGDVIKLLFPQVEIEGCHKDIYEIPHLYRVYKLDIYPTDFTSDFWNAPYKLSELKGE